MTLEITRTPAVIAGEINAIKDQVRSAALSASVEIGKRLQEAKAMIPEGEWTAWLNDHVSYSVRTAQNLMHLAAEYAAGTAQALAGLSYTKAVMLLSVPPEERDEFVDGHDVEGMSTRELQAALNALRARNDEMQVTMDQLIAEKKATEETMNAAVETAKDVNREAREAAGRLRDELKEAKEQLAKERKEARERLEKEREAAAAGREELERALQEARQAQTERAEAAPDVEQELAELRARLNRSQEEQALRAGYDLLKSSYTRLQRLLQTLAEHDAPLAEQFRAAFVRGLHLMADGLEEKEKSA